MKYLMVIFIASFSTIVSSGEATHEPKASHVISESDAVDLLLESVWYDVHAAQLAIEAGSSELAEWMAKAITRALVLASASDIAATDVSVPSLEALCVINRSNDLRNLIRRQPTGPVAISLVDRLATDVSKRISVSQKSYGGGINCSVGNGDGEVFR